MLRSLLHKHYIIYGGSIILTRGLEYVVLFFAAHYLTKNDYGELEFYKKIIEVGATFFAFGFPSLILSYTRSRESKNYFFILSVGFVVFLGLLALIFMGLFNWLFLVVPFVFYSIFFTGGVAQSYFLVKEGSNYTSIYKIILSVLFYVLVFLSYFSFDRAAYAYVIPAYILLPISALHIAYILRKEQLVWRKLKRYWRLFRKLLASSFTLVVANFTNMMFLYTDIFIIKFLSRDANVDIANYSFALNVSNMLLLIPMTLVQVDIEKLKQNNSYTRELNRKILIFIALATVLLIVFFKVLTGYYIVEYQNVFWLFLIILGAKIVQSQAPLYGTMLIVFKKFQINLIINLISLVINVVLSYLLFATLNIYGIALASVISLIIRQIMLYFAYVKAYKEVNKHHDLKY